jgi:hypothetical protein
VTGGSQQLRIFRRARRDGASIEAAAESAGIEIGEARLIAAEDAKNPPPPSAFELLGQTPAEEADVAGRRKARAPEASAEEIKKKDFAGAVRAYREDILPAQSKVGEHAQEQSTAYKHIKKHCHIQPTAARQAFRLDGMEEAKRDDWIRGFLGLLRELKIPLESADLVDMAEGKTAAKKPALATMGIPSDGSETDLADAGEGDPKDGSDGDDGSFDEAGEDELAAQVGRGAVRATKKVGEGFSAPLH